MHVEQAGHKFVQSIEGSPDLFAFVEPHEEFVRERAHVAVVVELLLAICDARYEGVCLCFDCGVSCSGIQRGACGEIVADKVAAEFRLWSLPAAEGRGLGGQASGRTEVEE